MKTTAPILIPAAIAEHPPLDWRSMPAQEKLDGWRGVLAFGGDEPATLTGRTAGVDWLAHVPHLAPVDYKGGRCVVDGEILPPVGFGVQAVQSILGGSVAAGRAWQKRNGLARFVAFDLMGYNGADVRLEEFAPEHFLSRYEGLRKLPLVVAELHNNAGDLFNAVGLAGGEGIVVRAPYAPYGQGAWKVKHFDTVDALVIGFAPGCGVAILGVDGVETGRVAIPSAIERVDIARNPGRFIGKWCEIQTFGKTDAGKARSPKFLRWGFDKPTRG